MMLYGNKELSALAMVVTRYVEQVQATAVAAVHLARSLIRHARQWLMVRQSDGQLQQNAASCPACLVGRAGYKLRPPNSVYTTNI